MTSRTILLVEDNPDDEALTLRAFKKNEIHNEVVVMRDGAEALAYLFPGDGAPSPGLVLLDLNLPKIGGLEVLYRIRADERTCMIPVVILTSSKLEEDILDCYRNGANAYVRKPINFFDFAQAINVLGAFWLLMNEPVRASGRNRIEVGHPEHQRDELEASQPEAITVPRQQNVVTGGEADSAGRAVRILILEDEAADVELARRLLVKAALSFTAVVVDTRASFVEQMAAFGPDLILSDCHLPGFSGKEALKIAQERYPDIPFIFWSGVLGDDEAVELIKQGATDYVLRDRPARLPTVILRALAEAGQRARLVQLEDQLLQAQRLASLGQPEAAAETMSRLRHMLTATRGEAMVAEPRS